MQGDVTAYPLTNTSSDKSGKKRRVLLGHTASILTGMKIVNSEKIITCDRDEKIRVSSFPNCWHIQGYLLGHTDYISSFDVMNNTTSNDKTLCVSCGGDGTIRLWDYESFQLIATYQQCSLHTNTDNGNSEKCKNDCNAFSCISIHDDGKYIATTQHSTSNINFYSVIEPKSVVFTAIITLVQTLSSPVLPISLMFLPKINDPTEISLLVLCLQPNYLIHYRLNHQNNLFQDISTTTNNSYYHNIISKLGKLYNIEMPTSNLLKSHLQGGRDHSALNDDTTTTTKEHNWNTAEKRDVARNRSNRRKYRKRQSK